MATTTVTNVTKTVEHVPATSSGISDWAVYISPTAALVLLSVLAILLVFFILRDRMKLQSEAEKEKAEADKQRAEYRNAVVTLYGTGPINIPASQVPADATLGQALQIYLNTNTTLRKGKADLQNDYDMLLTRVRSVVGQPTADVTTLLATLVLREDQYNTVLAQRDYWKTLSEEYVIARQNSDNAALNSNNAHQTALERNLDSLTALANKQNTTVRALISSLGLESEGLNKAVAARLNTHSSAVVADSILNIDRLSGALRLVMPFVDKDILEFEYWDNTFSGLEAVRKGKELRAQSQVTKPRFAGKGQRPTANEDFVKMITEEGRRLQLIQEPVAA